MSLSKVSHSHLFLNCTSENFRKCAKPQLRFDLLSNALSSPKMSCKHLDYELCSTLPQYCYIFLVLLI